MEHVRLEKLTVVQVVKKFTALHEKLELQKLTTES
jgi:hypothetical protein